MLFMTNTEKLLEIFIKYPTKEFGYRELQRKTKSGSSTIKRALKMLEKDGLIKKDKSRNYFFYESSRESRKFKIIKIFYTLNKLNEILENIVKKAHPNCIVLFGSASKGEDAENSDIDLFVQSEKKEIDASKTEKMLNRKINFIFEPNIKTINVELLNNLANGITLYGFLEVKS